ncbi:MAG: glycosyltransferase [bacterium LCO1.1]|uniref:Glycosyltransferase n=1 Tax=Candidatus Weimeria bifida TaxID=2599074 RepID=A0A6N7J0X4_9FIRM|nr:glycosyltransferase [Candidatus Weimeria bifida]
MYIYIGERNLVECLDSLKTQNYSNIEIILIDDGSKDRTADICHRIFQRTGDFVIYSKKWRAECCKKKWC